MKAPLVIGVQGLELTKEDQKRVAHPKVGGVILFSRNYESPGQLKKLNNSIKKISPSLQVMVDQEGGRVMRFREGFSSLPSLRHFGDLWDEKGPEFSCQEAQQFGALMARELLLCGVDQSLSPVVDRGVNQEVIGSRAFHEDPHKVTRLAEAWIMGMRSVGMKSVLKHFPGHGSVKGDTHVASLQDDRSFSEISATDLLPFSQLIQSGYADVVMASHVIYPQVDDRPASFSARWLKDILREQLGFHGLILSDDLGMQAAKSVKNPLEPIAWAVAAGCDQVLLCNDFEVMDEVIFNEVNHV